MQISVAPVCSWLQQSCNNDQIFLVFWPDINLCINYPFLYSLQTTPWSGWEPHCFIGINMNKLFKRKFDMFTYRNNDRTFTPWVHDLLLARFTIIDVYYLPWDRPSIQLTSILLFPIYVIIVPSCIPCLAGLYLVSGAYWWVRLSVFFFFYPWSLYNTFSHYEC